MEKMQIPRIANFRTHQKGLNSPSLVHICSGSPLGKLGEEILIGDKGGRPNIVEDTVESPHKGNMIPDAL